MWSNILNRYYTFKYHGCKQLLWRTRKHFLNAECCPYSRHSFFWLSWNMCRFIGPNDGIQISRRNVTISRGIFIFYLHNDVIKWKHFPRYLPFVRGIHRSPVNSPHKSQWRRSLMFTVICAWINDWVIHLEAGDWRRIRAHYDVTVMFWKETVIDLVVATKPGLTSANETSRIWHARLPATHSQCGLRGRSFIFYSVHQV